MSCSTLLWPEVRLIGLLNQRTPPLHFYGYAVIKTGRVQIFIVKDIELRATNFFFPAKSTSNKQQGHDK